MISERVHRLEAIDLYYRLSELYQDILRLSGWIDKPQIIDVWSLRYSVLKKEYEAIYCTRCNQCGYIKLKLSKINKKIEEKKATQKQHQQHQNFLERQEKKYFCKVLEIPLPLVEEDKQLFRSNVKKAYYTLSLIHHPDKGGDRNKFEEIKKAYYYLLNGIG